MTTSQIIILVAILCYLALMLSIGIRFSKQNKSASDFYLGGRKLGPLVTAMSSEASDMSSWLLMGLPGLAYISGICDPAWTAIGLAVGTWFNWLLVARKIRRYTEKVNAITVPDFFAKRYKFAPLTGIAALVIVIFFIPYTASGFSACGKLFSSLFGVDYMAAMIFCAVVIVAYTIIGGFLAASTTDLIQSIVMTIALLIVIIFGVNVAGGLGAVIDNAQSLPGYLSLTQTFDVTTGAAADYGVITTFSMLAWGLGYFGMPHILLRFMASKNEENLVTSRRIACTWVVISMAMAVFIGVMGLAMTKVGAVEDLTANNSTSETIIVNIAHLLSTHGVIPAILGGVILAGILAATMSTADSQLLAASSSVTHDILDDFLHIKVSDKFSVVIARVAIVIISIIAIFIASDQNSSVFNIVSFAWAGFGAAFGPVVLLALFWKRSNKWGALAGMIVGGAMVFIWNFGISTLGGIFDIYELLPSFICAIIVNVVVSLLTKAPDDEIVKVFEEVKEGR